MSFGTFGPGPGNSQAGNGPGWHSPFDPTNGGQNLPGGSGSAGVGATPNPPAQSGGDSSGFVPWNPFTWGNAVVGETEKLMLGVAFYGLLFLGVLGLILPNGGKQLQLLPDNTPEGKEKAKERTKDDVDNKETKKSGGNGGAPAVPAEAEEAAVVA